MQMNNSMNMMNNSVLETDLALLRRNAESIMRAIPAGTKLLPVLKCDAYMCPKGWRCGTLELQRIFWS